MKSEWDDYVKKNTIPLNIPITPQNVYKDFRWGDFLGTGRIANREKVYKPYNEAKRYALSLKLKTFEEWKKVKLPVDIPRNFHQTYKDEFEGWAVVLGNGNEKVDFISYDKAKKLIKSKGFKSKKQYLQWWRNTKDKLKLPGDPQRGYQRKNSWKGWKDFLGY